MALAKAQEIVSSDPVVVFSKTYCPYCTTVKDLLSKLKDLLSKLKDLLSNLKDLLSKLGAKYEVIELDKESDGSEIQSALFEWTRQRKVPNVFISGKHIGGCDSMSSFVPNYQQFESFTDRMRSCR